MNKEIEQINLKHGFDFAGMINIITIEEQTPYAIFFYDHDMTGVLEPHNDSTLIEANIKT